jgi:hypothetical protein
MLHSEYGIKNIKKIQKKLKESEYFYYCMIKGGMEYRGIVLLTPDRYVVDGTGMIDQPIEDSDCVISKDFLSNSEAMDYFLSNLKD